jgi:hypothetical protein
MPFSSAWERDTHFAKHGHEFGAADPSEYEQLADAFMYGSLGGHARECMRPSATDRIRFDFATHHEGVACTAPSFVRTFFIVRNRIVARHGGAAAYFAWDCGRVTTVDL